MPSLPAFLAFDLGGTVSSTITLAQMRDSIRLEGSWEGSGDITDALLNDFIRRAICQVWDLLKQKRDDLLVTSTTLLTAANVDFVPLTSDFYQLRKLEVADPSTPSGWRRLRKIDLDVAHRVSTISGKRYRYRLQGSRLVLHPTPQTIETLRMFYTPIAPILTDDDDTFDGINGYEELIFQLVVMKCRDRQEQDVSVQIREIDRLTAAIQSASDGRDVEPFYLNPYGANSSLGDADDDEAYWTS